MDSVLKISSRDNPHVKRARRVRDGKEAGLIFLEGLRLVDEAARSRTGVESVFATTELLAELDASHLTAWLWPDRIFEVSESLLQSIADTNSPQGIVVIAERPRTGPDPIEVSLRESMPLVVYLDQINNPSNLGAVIRTAEAAGVAGVMISQGSADVFSPKSLRAAMGSSLRLPLWTEVAFSEALDWSHANGLRTVAADVGGTRSYLDIDWSVRRMLVFGSEAHGLSDEHLEMVDERILIPMAREVESLNLGVACGVILFEARRQNAVR